MQKLAGIITESQLNENEEVNLLQFIKDNQNEIAKKLEVDRSTFQLGDKTYNIKYVINHPEEFLGKNVMYKSYLGKPQEKKIGKIDKSEGEVGFPEKRITSTDIDFSTKPFKPTDEEESLGKIKINGKTIYYVYYD